MRGFPEGGAEKAMEMKFGKAGLARCLLKQNTELVTGGEEIPSTTEPAEGVVMEKLRHAQMILPSDGRAIFRSAARRAARRAWLLTLSRSISSLLQRRPLEVLDLHFGDAVTFHLFDGVAAGFEFERVADARDLLQA
jgi:hypothetical protein